MTVSVFSAAYVDGLVEEAAGSPRLRQHRNIHSDYADPCQRLFNAIEPDSYIQPHRHGVVPRAELMIAVRGMLALVLFNDAGDVVDAITFGSGVEAGGANVAVETPPHCWHTVVALSPGSVLIEVKAGPFDPTQPKELAPWAPTEGADAASAYLCKLKALVRAMVRAA